MRIEHDDAKRASVYNLSADESVSEGVISAVSDFTDYSPIPGVNGQGSDEALEPLYHAIDPDALDALFERNSPESEARIDVSFQYMGYEITVSDDRQITIEQPELVL